VKDRLFNGSPALEMLDHNSLEKDGRHLGIPDPFRVDDNDWPTAANAEAWRFPALHPIRTEEKILSLQQLCEQRIYLSTAPVGRTEISGADEDVSRVRRHLRPQ
jgi:hypothetical protein